MSEQEVKVEESKELSAEEPKKLSPKEQEKLQAETVEQILKFKKDLKQLSKNQLVNIVIGLQLDIHKYQAIQNVADKMKSNSQKGEANV